MSVYMIADIKVTNAGVYRRYVAAVREIVERHGGRYHVRGGKVVPLFGDWRPERVILVEFDSMEQLRVCFGSEEYRRIAPLREQSTMSRSIVVEGV